MEFNPITLRFNSTELETDFQSEQLQKSLLLNRRNLSLGFILYAVFGVLDYFVASESLNDILIIRFGLICPVVLICLLIIYRINLGFWSNVVVLICCVYAALGIIAMIYFTRRPISFVYYSGLTLITIYIYCLMRYKIMVLTLTGVGLTIVYLIFEKITSISPSDILLCNLFFLVSTNALGIMSAYNLEYYLRKEFYNARLLEEEKVKTRNLILNILPESIANRLAEGESQIVDRFSEVSVIFIDLVGFTELSSRITPTGIVAFLNEIFSEFDSLAEKHNLEKIKTLGDGYMLAGGIPKPHIDHIKNSALMALAMHDFINKFDAAKEGWLKVRIGMHVGPVVAGIIGKRKFSYDLWGNTVNVASRLEQHCPPGNILVSEDFYEMAKEKFQFEPFGEIRPKGKNPIQAFILKGQLV